ncbi:hypothetical protein HAX54_010991, partial [Datura stramonium]|nr:hypothetical protein [Datura stramonium]
MIASLRDTAQWVPIRGAPAYRRIELLDFYSSTFPPIADWCLPAFRRCTFNVLTEIIK